MTSRCLSLLAIALCASTAFAQTPPARPAPAAPAQPRSPSAASPRPPRAAAPTFDRARYAIPHKTFVLDNGLTLDALEGAAVQLLNLGYPDDYFVQYATRARALDEAALDVASRQYIRPKEILWLVVGDLAKVEAGIRDLKLGEVIRLEAH
jgi:hypothetical protein